MDYEIEMLYSERIDFFVYYILKVKFLLDKWSNSFVKHSLLEYSFDFNFLLIRSDFGYSDIQYCIYKFDYYGDFPNGFHFVRSFKSKEKAYAVYKALTSD